MFSIWQDLLYNPLLNFLLFLYNTIPGHDLGIAIVIMTVIIRLLILPLGLKAARSQRKMKKIMPELNKLKDQYKGDPQELAKAQVAFYKQYQVNPWSSCLPILIQLPVFIALYRTLGEGLKAINPAHVYSFIHAPAQLNTQFFGLLDLAKPELIVIPVLAGLTQYGLTIMTVNAQAQPQVAGSKPTMEQMMNKQMSLIVPVMTYFIARSFPAGLGFYLVTTTLFSIAQQFYVNHEKAREVTVRIKHKGEHQEEIVVEELPPAKDTKEGE
ncbi:MAG: YidC/Oxa1 family membrane protein insertase [Patescibacteria group bacterium]